jgi:hypothetical protein
MRGVLLIMIREKNIFVMLEFGNNYQHYLSHITKENTNGTMS